MLLVLQSQHELTHFVVITKAYDTTSPTKQSSSSKGAAKKPHLDPSTHELVYEYPEMELFVKVNCVNTHRGGKHRHAVKLLNSSLVDTTSSHSPCLALRKPQ